MSRIGTRLQDMKAHGRKALVAYIVNGDPYPEATLPAMHAMVAQGVDIIELGVPFSDPMAEGPVIQKGHERALVHGTSLKGTFELVREFRKTNSETPVVLMGYLNPIERMGYKTVAETAAAAGVDGLLTVDLPPEEAAPLKSELTAVGLDNILLLAPTTTVERARRVTALATGFLYYVSLKGVTGAGHLDVDAVKSKLAEFGQLTELPMCVGFGIKDPATARAVADLADGVVIGSVLVSKMGDLADASADDIAAAVGDIVGSIRLALDA
ncbi:tryptophan synthase subunit alpha [Marinimicrobium sp. ABcell2]|uniref:tryptophan synthase subunit alpha n=1 Tax=Marinimicrobium sp. ABcell2 TaxID=3069751 RepID=UPI0027B16A87|nr:tryptophan synthase subunit alpha [Marinimicrobium sp. ABcell2]MDQ2075535.1 tryptophan synthase subunit alpha [Marinimicrobium sp. ABcell2]